jgi:hypothetical protein
MLPLRCNDVANPIQERIMDGAQSDAIEFFFNSDDVEAGCA